MQDNSEMNRPKTTTPTIDQASIARYAKAFARQKSLTDAQWLQRCDELAVEQRILFLELLTFSRDGLPPKQFRGLIDYLSVLQFVSAAVSKSASAPVLLPEFQAAIKRAIQFFHAITTDDRAHFERLVQAWGEGTVNRSEPTVWAGCVETLRDPDILAHPLSKDVVVTLYAIADVFSRRLEKVSSQPQP
jgi:hypothetical protein